MGFFKTIAELCNGSTYDSDSYCLGSNPSSAAKPPSGGFFVIVFCNFKIILVSLLLFLLMSFLTDIIFLKKTRKIGYSNMRSMRRKIELFFLSFILSIFFLYPHHTSADFPYTEPPAGSDVSFIREIKCRTKKKVLPSNKLSLEYWEATRTVLALSGDLRKDIITIARSQIGYREDTSSTYLDSDDGLKYYSLYGDWYGRPYSYWCDIFVSFCIFYAGLKDYPFEYSCFRHELLLKKYGYWKDWNAYIPQPGDIVFLGLIDGSYGATHTGIVEMVVPPTETLPARLITIEGNVSFDDGGPNGVRRVERSFSNVIGYGVYEAGQPMMQQVTLRCDDNPFKNYIYTEPDYDVLKFIGAEDTVYARQYFPAD